MNVGRMELDPDDAGAVVALARARWAEPFDSHDHNALAELWRRASEALSFGAFRSYCRIAPTLRNAAHITPRSELSASRVIALDAGSL